MSCMHLVLTCTAVLWLWIPHLVGSAFNCDPRVVCIEVKTFVTTYVDNGHVFNTGCVDCSMFDV